MESSDKKTPPRPAAGRPSLLSADPRSAADSGSPTRMLASLERGERTPGAVPSGQPRSRRGYGLALLALVLLGGVGAFVALQPSSDASTAAVQAAVPAAHAASTAVAAAPAASAQIELAALSATPADAASAAPMAVAAASQPASSPLDKLALNDGETAAATAAAATAAAAASKASAKASPPAKPRTKPAAAPKTSVADAKAAASRKAKKPEEDADTELVAAMINRLDRRGAKPASPVVPAAARDSESVPANLAALVRECSSKTDLLEARQCRNRTCEKHWGKTDACPASRAPKTSPPSEVVIHDKPS